MTHPRPTPGLNPSHSPLQTQTLPPGLAVHIRLSKSLVLRRRGSKRGVAISKVTHESRTKAKTQPLWGL